MSVVAFVPAIAVPRGQCMFLRHADQLHGLHCRFFQTDDRGIQVYTGKLDKLEPRDRVSKFYIRRISSVTVGNF